MTSHGTCHEQAMNMPWHVHEDGTMVNPWHVHEDGIMVHPWHVHGNVPWLIIACHGLFMAVPRHWHGYCHGLTCPMAHARFMARSMDLSMDHPWPIADQPWISEGLSMDHPCTRHGVQRKAKMYQTRSLQCFRIERFSIFLAGATLFPVYFRPSHDSPPTNVVFQY